MSYFAKYIELREELWKKFEDLVRTGCSFPSLLNVDYPPGINIPGLSKTTEGNCYFLAKSLKANPSYALHIGQDIIVGVNKVVFFDIENIERELEPDTLDLYWLSELVDQAITSDTL
jgi:hypothetical protein